MFRKQTTSEIEFNSSFLQEYVTDVLNNNRKNEFFSEENLYKVAQYIDYWMPILTEHFHVEEETILNIVKELYELIVHNNYDVIEERDFFKLLGLKQMKFLIGIYANDYNSFIKLKQFYNVFNNKFEQNDSAQYYTVDRWINLVDYMSRIYMREDVDIFEIGLFNDTIDYAIDVRRYYVNDDSYIAEIESFLTEQEKKRLSLFGIQHHSSLIEKRIEEVKKISGVYNYETLDFNKLYHYAYELKTIKQMLDEVESKISETNTQIESMRDTSTQYQEKIKKLETDVSESLTKKFDSYLTFQVGEVEKEWQLINMMLSMISKELINVQLSTIEKSKVDDSLQHSSADISNSNESIQVVPKPRQVISSKPIFYFRNDIPLKNRLDILFKQKDNNQLYHEKFNQVIKSVLNNDLVYLVGQSGTGKTYLAQQIAQILDIPLYNIGFVVDEFLQIRGAMDANSRFIESPFYPAYKYGGICFFDEIDVSESKALMELNKIVGSHGYQPYTFANGETVTAHPNFRIIAAGNTWGDGSTLVNNAREKLDEATMNRFTTYEITYDEKLEREIMHDHNELYEALILLRHCYQENDYPYIITTRDMREIVQKLDTGCFDLDEIIQTKIVRNKRADTLETLSRYLSCNGHDDFAKRLKKCKK